MIVLLILVLFPTGYALPMAIVQNDRAGFNWTVILLVVGYPDIVAVLVSSAGVSGNKLAPNISLNCKGQLKVSLV